MTSIYRLPFFFRLILSLSVFLSGSTVLAYFAESARDFVSEQLPLLTGWRSEGQFVALVALFLVGAAAGIGLIALCVQMVVEVKHTIWVYMPDRKTAHMDMPRSRCTVADVLREVGYAYDRETQYVTIDGCGPKGLDTRVQCLQSVRIETRERPERSRQPRSFIA